ncbi:MAG: glycosyltransferase [Anaerolineae bacterium]
MIISILTGGSRGDVQPYIGLGKGLKRAGYEVRLIASDDFEPLVTKAGLAFYSTGFSVESVIQSDEWRAVTERGNFLTIISKMRGEMKNQAQKLAMSLPDVLADSDLLIAGAAGLGGGFAAADKLGVPVIQAYLFPLTPTREFPSPLTPRLPLGGLLNPVSFQVTRQLLWQSTRMADVETRRILGMPKGSFWGPFRSLQERHTPSLYGYSRHVVPSPTDWPENHHVTGYWFLDESTYWQPPADFQAFLDDGPAPVYVGFGSMLNKNPEQVADVVLQALKKSGQRGVMASGWGGMSPADMPDNVVMISSMPHDWLFPRMAAVVHHGGAGTTAAGLRAGIPSIVIPFMGDQPFWGQRVLDLGVGPNPIPRKKLSVETLAQAIDQAVHDTAMRERAAALGSRIRAEGGMENAVRIIQTLMAHTPIPERVLS